MTEQNPEPKRHTIETRIHGHYLMHEPEGTEPAPLLVGFHGYGETAEAHLEELLKIPGSQHWRVVSVGALHRFYTKSGDVVSSWMTSADRELAIEDNLAYVDAVVDELKSRHTLSDTLVYAGFSQGVAMAYRAAARGPHKASGVLALAGDLPSDVKELKGSELPPVLLGCGSSDAWYTPKKLEHDRRYFDVQGLKLEVCVFNAGHVWHDTFREAAGKFLSELVDNILQ